MKPVKNKKGKKFNIEILIVLAIAICVIGLIQFSDKKLNAVMVSNEEALFMNVDPNDPLSLQLAQEIRSFRPDACKLMEIYSEDYTCLLRVQFRDEPDTARYPITSHDGLIDILNNNIEGNTQIEINDETEDVYFKWTFTEDGQKCLIMLYTSRPTVENFWIFHIICYTILVLAFILLLLLRFRNHREYIRYYNELSDRAQEAYTI